MYVGVKWYIFATIAIFLKSVWAERSVDSQKSRRNFLITGSNSKFPTPRSSSLQRRSFDMYISAVDPKDKKLAVLS